MTNEEAFFRESTGQRFGEINMKIVTPEMIFKAMKEYKTSSAGCTFLVDSQFCPKCNPSTYGNNMVQIRMENEQCSSCGYMITNHVPFANKLSVELSNKKGEDQFRDALNNSKLV